MTTEKLLKTVQKQEEQIKNFDVILKSLNTIDDKKKALLLLIYQNCLDDRDKSEVLYNSCLEKILEDASNIAILGIPASKFLEKLIQSNGQILELANLLQKLEEEKKEKFDPDEVFNTLQKQKK